ncbi:histidine phosphatase family protein [Microlunatus spumicola]|uniref:Histidine phosphatase family protein n=1 Tax=Microlunatus spumicola TaxID=81499 RepID=A0ABP6X0E0_9ACTN
MRLLLIRHGQTPANVRGALDTAFPGLGLTDLGQAQAAAVPAALADEQVVAVYASPLVRTQLTAAPLAAARGVTAEVRPGLEEVSAGALEMREDPEGIQGYVDALAAWMAGDLDHAMPGGPDGHAFWRRYDDAIAALAERHPGETVAVFSHGAAIRVWSALAAHLSVERAAELSIANTGMATLEGDRESGWHLERWHADPLGGHDLLDVAAQDVTGESAEEATGS